MDKINKSESEWKTELSPEEYTILREAGTEAPFTGKYYKTKDDGVYHCAACDNPLFTSHTKYDSGSGWPSFWQPITPESVELIPDSSHGMLRTEVRCGRCGSHLGHLFEDGPKETTGMRYCMNSISLKLKSDHE